MSVVERDSEAMADSKAVVIDGSSGQLDVAKSPPLGLIHRLK
jgi:hypothetical protein